MKTSGPLRLRHLSVYCRGNRGSIFPVLALALVVLIVVAAITIDIGHMANDANRLQRGCDAAALAGAARLQFIKTGFAINNNSGSSSTIDVTPASQTAARTDAILVSGKNGVVTTPNDVTFPTIYRVCVSVPESVNMFFARFWGASTNTITRQATAEKKPVAGIGGAAPLGICAEDYNKYRPGGSLSGELMHLSLVVSQSESFGPGNMIALSMDDDPSKPVSVFEDEVTNGYSPKVSIGQTVNSLNGTTSVQKAAYEGLATRLQQGDTRFPVLIVPPKEQTNGTSYFVGNLTFIELVSVSSPKQSNPPEPTQIYIRFINIPGVDLSKYPVDLTTTSNVSDIYVLRLVDDL